MLRFASIAILLAGCAKGPGLEDSGSTSVDKACDDGVPPDTYVAGLTRSTTDGSFTVTLDDALPSPPDVGMNTFVATVDAPAGSLVRLRPWMPLHGHGSSPEWWNGTEAAGVWTFEDVNLHMAGLWELRFTVDSNDADTGALFRFCLEG